ncbi:hypothetical protein [Companilactobacillus futsaii]|uniref:Uncharacterized protein n=2 Tax=Companilactobacillus futsaii TaxID=938155 RepID=A0A5B7SZS9_9LACO|nr:hypothetical protein [Companilactobacillus futsaii]KRK91140.1 hypothetical protein FC88_GL001434 [Companilactobacillus futsaii JCM 17355]QCX23839.1 hypothetical protein FG051_01410 [Companilactobacillus futsaii]
MSKFSFKNSKKRFQNNLNDFQKHTASSKKSLIHFKSTTWFIRKEMTVVNSRLNAGVKGL